MLGGPNGDLWSVLFTLLDRREHETRFFKIRSHQEDETVRQIIAQGISEASIIGNALADQAAEVAEAKIQTDVTQSNAANANETTAYLVALRLAVIQKRIWDCETGARTHDMPKEIVHAQIGEAEVLDTIARSIAKNGHRLQKAGTGMACEHCGVRRGVNRNEYWVQTKCRPRWAVENIVKRHKSLKSQVTSSTSDTKAAFSELVASACGLACRGQNRSTTDDKHRDDAKRRRFVTRMSCSNHEEGTNGAVKREQKRKYEAIAGEELTAWHEEEELIAPYPFEEPPPEFEASILELHVPEMEVNNSSGQHHSSQDKGELVTRATATAARKRIAEQLNAVNKAAKTTRKMAWEKVKRGVNVVNAIVDDEGWDESVVLQLPPNIHISHHMLQAKRLQIIYCKDCGAWSKGGKLRNLAKICSGPTVRARTTVRLLEEGIVPGSGNCIPKEFKRGTKGTRR